MFNSRENKKVPNTEFKIIEGTEWRVVTTDEIFKDKKVVVFSLPGAFTPTCSTSHLPRYDELASKFKEEGVDEIVVVSVNDTFVMNAWEKDQGTQNITFIPDGNGTFTDGMEMLVDKEDLGFGKRSWRYSMLVVDGVVEKQFIEPDEAGDPFKVSDADTMLNYINPKALEKEEGYVLFTKSDCPYCVKAKSLLESKGINYEEVNVGNDVSASVVVGITGRKTVPQIFKNGTLIGGSDDLEAFLK